MLFGVNSFVEEFTPFCFLGYHADRRCKKYYLPYTLLTDPERCENCRYLKVVCDGNADRRCKKISFTLYAFDRSGAVRKLPLSQSGLRRKCGPPLQKISLTLYAFDRSGAVRKLPLSQSGLRRKCGPPLRLTKGCVRGIIIVKTMA